MSVMLTLPRGLGLTFLVALGACDETLPVVILDAANLRDRYDEKDVSERSRETER